MAIYVASNNKTNIINHLENTKQTIKYHYFNISGSSYTNGTKIRLHGTKRHYCYQMLPWFYTAI